MSETAPRDLMTRLKEDTRGLHDEAEQAAYMGMLMAGRLPKPAFAFAVQQLSLIQIALEDALTDIRTTSPRAAAALRDHHFVLGALTKQDVADLGGDADAKPSAGTQHFLARLAHWKSSDPEAVLGMLYVLEGSLNGAKILLGKYTELFAIADSKGTRHLDPHGREMRPRWMEFVGVMNQQDFPESTKLNMVSAAGDTFKSVGMMYGDAVKAR